MSNVFTASNDLSRTHLLARFLRHAWAAYWRWQMRRATVRLLHSLDDRMLRDIGVNRDEVDIVFIRED
jgi:uncharacterized protein YjiS (DUF1127 family)